VEESARQQRECVVRRLLKIFAADESGATALEYALIACLISISIVGVLHVIGPSLSAKYTAVGAAFT
jgi:pilus assembly protein Flp/PilA